MCSSEGFIQSGGVCCKHGAKKRKQDKSVYKGVSTSWIEYEVIRAVQSKPETVECVGRRAKVKRCYREGCKKYAQDIGIVSR